jgi:hypothetical protein
MGQERYDPPASPESASGGRWRADAEIRRNGDGETLRISDCETGTRPKGGSPKDNCGFKEKQAAGRLQLTEEKRQTAESTLRIIDCRCRFEIRNGHIEMSDEKCSMAIVLMISMPWKQTLVDLPTQ